MRTPRFEPQPGPLQSPGERADELARRIVAGFGPDGFKGIDGKGLDHMANLTIALFMAQFLRWQRVSIQETIWS